MDKYSNLDFYVNGNLMTKDGESNNFSVKDFVFEIENCLDSKVDYIIYNNNNLFLFYARPY